MTWKRWRNGEDDCEERVPRVGAEVVDVDFDDFVLVEMVRGCAGTEGCALPGGESLSIIS